MISELVLVEETDYKQMEERLDRAVAQRPAVQA